MRLLQRAAPDGSASTTTHEFCLTEFAASRIPLVYAVLSHRWEEDEVTFKDIENGTAHTKAGYRKLVFCAEQAARDGISYFWCDTCCINKDSSAELQEAINSMYKWYHKSTKCYVYMQDVSVMDYNNAQLTEKNWHSSFRSSTWFTRGWTLQELIAPTKVEFFSVEGRWLGDKSSLEQQIQNTTGLPVQALRGNLSGFDVQERLSWAAKRTTTVEEDAAYCLLGIVDVHMPLIYAEGAQKAMARLQRELQLSSIRIPEVQSPVAGAAVDASRNSDPSRQRTPAREVMEWEGVLQSLSYPEMEYRNHNVDDAQNDTCSWLLNHTCYQEWNSQTTSNPLLMIRGKPGSGKSTAMKRAYTLARETANAKEAVLAFFFNSRGIAMETNLEGFFRSTLHQLLEPKHCTDDEGFTEFKRKTSSMKSGWAWTVKELQKMFERCLSRLSVKVTIFVDALDECGSVSDARDLMKTITGLGSDGSCRSTIKICVSSRHYPNTGVAEPLRITVEQLNRNDISKYATNTLQRLKSELQHADAEDLAARITSRAEGIFLWALLVIQKIQVAVHDGESRRTIHKIIDLVPQRLEELFQELIDSTAAEHVEQRNLIILWTLFAKRPLTLSELNHALAFRQHYSTYSDYRMSEDFTRPEQTRRLLASCTRGLVEVVEAEEWNVSEMVPTLRVQFIHESVRQYILGAQSTIGPASDLPWTDAGSAHNSMALSCFKYIKAVCVEEQVVVQIIEQSQARKYATERLHTGHTQDRSFLDYAIEFGCAHAETAEATGYPQTHIFESMAKDSRSSVAWWEPFTAMFRLYQKHLYNHGHGHWSDYNVTRLAFACAFKLDSWVHYLLHDDVSSQNKLDLSRALRVTAVSGHVHQLGLLLKAGADVDYDEPMSGTSLYMSLINNRLDVAKCLVEHKASVHMGPQKRSPLVAASEYGSAEVVRLLLAHGAQMTECEPRTGQSMSALGMHALEAASCRGYEVMEMLLNAAEDQQVPIEYYKAAFLAAEV